MVQGAAFLVSAGGAINKGNQEDICIELENNSNLESRNNARRMSV